MALTTFSQIKWGGSIKYYAYVYRDPSRLNARGFFEEIYVGKGSWRRAYDHLRRIDVHPFVQRLQKMKRNGVEPLIEIIPALDEDHALFLEQCLVDLLGRKVLKTGTLLNLKDGGEKCHHTVASILKMKQYVKTEQHRRNIALSKKGQGLGKKNSPETRLKISLANTGKKCPQRGRSHHRPITEAAKIKMRDAKLNAPYFSCPHCTKQCKAGMAKRHHFDNCKYRNGNRYGTT